MAIGIIGVQESDPINGYFHNFVESHKFTGPDNHPSVVADARDLRIEAADILARDERVACRLAGASALLEIALTDQEQEDIRARRLNLYDARDIYRDIKGEETDLHFIAAQSAIAQIPILETAFLKQERVSRLQSSALVERLMMLGTYAEKGLRANRNNEVLGREYTGVGVEIVALATVNDIFWGPRRNGSQFAVSSTVSQDRDARFLSGLHGKRATRRNWDVSTFDNHGDWLSIRIPHKRIQIKAKDDGMLYEEVEVVYFDQLKPKSLDLKYALWRKIAKEYVYGKDGERPAFEGARQILGGYLS